MSVTAVEHDLKGLPVLRQDFGVVSPAGLLLFSIGILLVDAMLLFAVARGNLGGFEHLAGNRRRNLAPLLISSLLLEWGH